jgi:outer membrane protein insertion porin family
MMTATLRTEVVTLALAAMMLFPHTAGAQTAAPPVPDAGYIGKPIVEVRLVSEGRPADDPASLALVETRVGQPLSMTAVRASITHLFGLGRFQDVRVEAIDAPGGVALRYDLVPLHSVHRVDFRGTAGLSEGLLRQTMTNRFGAAPPVGRAPEIARLLEQLYREHGYLRATVRPRATEQHDPDRTLLEFEVDAGPQARIGSVTIDGVPAEGRDAFLREVHARPSTPYEPPEIASGLAGYVAKLRKRGRYLAAASYRPRPSDDGTVVDLAIELETGPVVTVAFRGDPLPQDKLAELAPIAREGSVDQDLIEDSIQRIKSYLTQQGYWKADASAERQEGEGTLTVAFTVRRGLPYRIADGVDVVGNQTVPLEQLRPALAKLQANDVFIESNLGAAVSGIAGTYQRLGFARAKVAGAANELNPSATGQGLVRPVITITEGPLTLVGDVTFDGQAIVPQEQLRAVVKSAPGAPFYQPQVVADYEAVLLEYRNRGFAAASVVVVPGLSEDGTRADLRFQIHEGQQTIVDHILIVGNTRTDARVITRELLLQEGKPLGLEDLIESQRRLGALGLFRRIRIDPLSHASGGTTDVLVTVEEAATATFSYGGGLEVSRLLRAGEGGGAEERIEFAPRGYFDVGRRNIGGKNRSVNLFTRLSLRPKSPEADGTERSGFGFSEYRVVGTFREPRALGVNADLSLTAAIEQGVRSSFNFARKGVNAEMVHRPAPGIRTSARYSFGTTRTFDEQLEPEDQARIDRIFPRVRLSGFSGAISRDTRDDVLEPTRGTFLSADGSLAARALGGQVGFLKSYMQGLWFRRVPVTSRVIFASRLAVGLADGFERVVQSTDEQGNSITEVVDDLPASERFFAGGDTSVRGFALDTVGAPNTISSTGFPRGGHALLLMNGEVRVPVWGDIGAAVFLEGGNVFNRVTEFDFGELRGSAGFGIRYRSPIGPIRFDIGFKIDRRETLSGELERRPAFHFAIGQVF